MPLFWLSLAFLVGIWLGKITGWSQVSWGILALISLAGWIGSLLIARFLPGFSIYRLRLPNPANFPYITLPFTLLLLAVSLGGLRFQLAQPVIDDQKIVCTDGGPG